MEPSPTDRERSVFPGFAAEAAEPSELIGRLAAVRSSLGLSQTDVAARMGTSQSAIARLESGQADVRLSTLTRYAAALDVSIGYLVRQLKESDDGHRT